MIKMKSPKISYEENESKNFARFTVEPLERGFGTTLGNSLRRILLSAPPGAAIVGIKIAGVDHEFSTIKGVKEDVTEIILNLKGVAVKLHNPELFNDKIEISLYRGTPGPVTAGDITTNSDVEIMNPDAYICTLDAGAVLDMRIFIDSGRGYVSAEKNKDAKAPIGYIPIDSIFTPVEKANYTVESTRVEQSIDFDKLTIEVLTNGTITAKEIISLAAKILNDHIKLFVDLVDVMGNVDILVSQDDDKHQKVLEMSVEDLDLSVRSYNCLKRASINTVEDLTKKTEEDMLKVRNLGRKSLEEVIKKLEDLGLSLRRSED
ncbi:MAG TPA: DNA-directed RNA polymerase subunit alpha [Clostridia bacterium]|nr:DNA-directed RNA polymerase subunit alpha [Clostridia bacterium]HRU83837.1 DNA-directed RNA polymerase subunit alpha [Eubacteriales bacterium]